MIEVIIMLVILIIIIIINNYCNYRGNYVVDPLPYDDRPHYIGMGQTISAPHMHGYALQNLAPAIMVI